eukprot:CAMPEP_0172747120 /NCGR_PEP_ID=MMETSP1074-20121228/142069_1 /TAXON_ID=2916 /ORGANISM="Ceratium fusus, Strain PA161109" /LENGTH=58 /DNA_ID=CAMNT_0013578583 /DNA_START=87 /DNA_END=259 /DNA_ORIENTATION=+
MTFASFGNEMMSAMKILFTSLKDLMSLNNLAIRKIRTTPDMATKSTSVAAAKIRLKTP